MRATSTIPIGSSQRAVQSKCCPNTPARMIPRDVNEDARDTARALSRTEAFEQSRRDRKRVEMLFAHLKRVFRLNSIASRCPSLRGRKPSNRRRSLTMPRLRSWPLQAHLGFHCLNHAMLQPERLPWQLCQELAAEVTH
jgi:hypothetical protein